MAIPAVFSKSNYSVIQFRLTVSGSQLQDTIWKVPEDLLLCGVNSGVWLHILSELPFEGVELHYGQLHAYNVQCGYNVQHCSASLSGVSEQRKWMLDLWLLVLYRFNYLFGVFVSHEREITRKNRWFKYVFLKPKVFIVLWYLRMLATSLSRMFWLLKAITRLFHFSHSFS